MQIETFMTLVAAFGAVIVLVIRGAPALARLLFRHRLEAVHADAVDAILDGQLRLEPPVKAFMRIVEQGEEHARWMTLPRSLAVLRALYDLGVENPGALARRPSFCDLDQSERKIMHSLEDRLYAAFQSYMIWGTLLGWLFAPVMFTTRRWRRGGKRAQTDSSLPNVARDALYGDLSKYPKAARWAARSRHSYAHR